LRKNFCEIIDCERTRKSEAKLPGQRNFGNLIVAIRVEGLELKRAGAKENISELK
jgi:hypothetical protein